MFQAMGLTRSCGLLRKMGMEVRVRTPHKFEFSQLEDPDQGFSIQHKRKDSFNALFEDRLAPMRIDTFLAYMASLSFSVCVMTPYVVRCCYCCLLCICPDPPGCSHCVQEELMLIGLSYLFIYLFIIYLFIYYLFIYLSIYSSIYSFTILDHLSIIHLSLIYFYYWRSRLWGRLLFWHVGQPSFLAGTWAAFFIWEVGCLFGRGGRLSFWQHFFSACGDIACIWWGCSGGVLQCVTVLTKDENPYTDYTFGYGLSQWETTLKCNVVSHWLSPYRGWSLHFLGTLLAPCHVVKYLQLIWSSGTSTGVQSSNEFQWLDLKLMHRESSPGNCHQGDMTHMYVCRPSCSCCLSVVATYAYSASSQVSASSSTTNYRISRRR